VETLPIVTDEVIYDATCHMCAARVSRRVLPVPPLHTTGNPSPAASTGGLPAIGTQATHPAGGSAALGLGRPRVVRVANRARRGRIRTWNG
jgi:hypothetical protein